MHFDSHLTTGYSQIIHENKALQNQNQYKSPETPVWDYIRDIWSSQSQNSNTINKSFNSSIGYTKDNQDEVKLSDFMENVVIIEKKINFLNQKIASLMDKLKNLQEVSNRSGNQEIRNIFQTLNTIVNSLKAIEVQKSETLNSAMQIKDNTLSNSSNISMVKNKITKNNKRKRKRSDKNKIKLYAEMEKIAKFLINYYLI